MHQDKHEDITRYALLQRKTKSKKFELKHAISRAPPPLLDQNNCGCIREGIIYLIRKFLYSRINIE